MKHAKILSRLWLWDNESKIYLFLLENPLSSIVDISSKTSLHRPLIYKILPNLVESWLVSEVIKWKRKVYKAGSPESLKSLFDNFSQSFNMMLPELESIYNTWDKKPSIQIFQWKNWVKQVFVDVVTHLKKWDTYYRYSSRKNFNVNFLPADYRRIRDEKQIQRLVITSEFIAKGKKEKAEREIATIPRWFDMFDDNVAKLIYWDRVAIIDYNSLTSVIIENSLLARFEEKIFKMFYKYLKNTERGI